MQDPVSGRFQGCRCPVPIAAGAHLGGPSVCVGAGSLIPGAAEPRAVTGVQLLEQGPGAWALPPASRGLAGPPAACAPPPAPLTVGLALLCVSS